MKFQTKHAINRIVLSSAYEVFPTSSDLLGFRKQCYIRSIVILRVILSLLYINSQFIYCQKITRMFSVYVSFVMSKHKDGKKCGGFLYREPLKVDQSQTIEISEKYEIHVLQRKVVNKPDQNFLVLLETLFLPCKVPHLAPITSAIIFLCYFCNVT